MSDLIGICTRILRDVDYDLIPADVVVTGGKVRDWGIEQREFEHGQGLAPVAPKRVIRYEGTGGNLPEFTTGCPECDRMPFGQLCERCDYDMTVTAASYRCQ